MAMNKKERAEGIYVASKAKHGPMWKEYRDIDLYPITSTWIDECGAGETSDWPDLWTRCVKEASECGCLVAYRANENEEMKGAMVEIGAALAHGKRVFCVGFEYASFVRHPLVTSTACVATALRMAKEALQQSQGVEPCQ